MTNWRGQRATEKPVSIRKTRGYKAKLGLGFLSYFLNFSDIAILLGDRYGHLLTLYESLMLRRLLATDPDTRWCPRPNCTYAVIATGCASCPKIECERPGCGMYIFP